MNPEEDKLDLHFRTLTPANTLGYIHFTGKTDGCLLWNRYGSSMFADSLVCREAEVYNESIGNVYVNATDNIKAFIRGQGNIFYHGTPVIKVIETKGAGKLVRLDYKMHSAGFIY